MSYSFIQVQYYTSLSYWYRDLVHKQHTNCCWHSKIIVITSQKIRKYWSPHIAQHGMIDQQLFCSQLTHVSYMCSLLLLNNCKSQAQCRRVVYYYYRPEVLCAYLKFEIYFNWSWRAISRIVTHCKVRFWNYQKYRIPPALLPIVGVNMEHNNTTQLLISK